MGLKEKLMSNTSYLFMEWTVTTISTMLFWIVLAKSISPKSYGIAATTLQIASLLGTVSLFGIKSANEKLIPEFLREGRKDKVQGLIKFSLKVVLITSLLLGSSLFILSPFLSPILGLDQFIIKVLAVPIFAISFALVFGGFHYGFQNMKRYFLGTFFGEIVFITSAVILTSLGFGYWSAIIAYTLCFSVSFIVRFSPKMLRVSKKSIADRKYIFRYSLPAFIVTTLAVIFSQSHFIILSALQGPEITGIFAVAMKIVSVLAVIPMIFSMGLFPITSSLSADEKSKSKQAYLISLVFRYSMLVILPLSILIVFFSDYLVLFFSSEEYLGATSFLPLLVIGGVFLGLAKPFTSSLYAIGEPKKYMFSHLLTTAIYLLLAFILTNRLSAMGLVISYTISSMILFFMTFLLLRRKLVIKFPTVPIAKIFLGLILSFIFLVLTRPFISSILLVPIFTIFSGIIFFLTLLMTGFFVEEDLKILDFVVERMPLFKGLILKIKKYLSGFVDKSYLN